MLHKLGYRPHPKTFSDLKGEKRFLCHVGEMINESYSKPRTQRDLWS